MSERDAAQVRGTPQRSAGAAEGEAGHPDGDAGPVNRRAERSAGKAESGEVSSADSLPALVLLVSANVLLRFLGEHGWAYWTAAVLGVLGVAAAGVGLASAVGSLRRGRRRLVAGYTVVLLAAACFAFVVRLIQN
ncbi:hypothetical protein ACFWUQ_21960 [Streptomyces sp. NPDC058662]|uniref:hypothetical protein n=1 Tax=Streptomyces sp. NPDC058662 TaxID=3346583 RepID=UPI00366047C4